MLVKNRGNDKKGLFHILDYDKIYIESAILGMAEKRIIRIEEDGF